MRRRSQGVVDLHGEVRAPTTGQGRAAARKGRRSRDIRRPGAHLGRHGLPDPGLYRLTADTEGVRQRTPRPADHVGLARVSTNEVTVPGPTQVPQVGGYRGREGGSLTLASTVVPTTVVPTTVVPGAVVPDALFPVAAGSPAVGIGSRERGVG